MNKDNLQTILQQIQEERARQDVKWGLQDHPSFKPSLKGYHADDMAKAYEIPSESRAKWICDSMAQKGDLTFSDILIEEVAEVIGTCNKTTADTRMELIQVAAVVVSWIESIDRNL